jgi:uncharacterized membrane protein YqjE
MTEAERGAGAARHPSVLQSLRSGVAAVVSALHTRLELFVTELEEERERLKQALALALLLFFGISLGFILLNIFVVAIFWQAGWVYAIGGLALLYLSVGIAAGLMLRKKILTSSRFFLATLGELAKDRDRLRSSSHE